MKDYKIFVKYFERIPRVYFSLQEVANLLRDRLLGRLGWLRIPVSGTKQPLGWGNFAWNLLLHAPLNFLYFQKA